MGISPIGFILSFIHYWIPEGRNAVPFTTSSLTPVHQRNIIRYRKMDSADKQEIITCCPDARVATMV